MNESLIERIKGLRALSAPGNRCAKVEILADVRELVEVLKLVEFETNGVCKICNGWNVGPNGRDHWNRPGCGDTFPSTKESQ